ncbi:hypothetical protein [Evansella cellulosilytica]|uniref:Extracellular solute-binding protein n=1 Tax=Evansella cellulosilytica (strain ATCC 21833 / DSM 2522 / FERM P-1141 / JCM 9156 / N-4) TaxID=649639 RepID=E6TXK7_EVAC2|nr:hypothetical protein [Evansella cellulosilytica]ADU28821.1 hypothetical protein Bcell_0539 [Evansella cellulosilytica DSM 2522]
MKIRAMIMVLISLFLLAGCGSEASDGSGKLQIMFLSEVPNSYEANFIPYIEDIIRRADEDPDNIEIIVQIYPISHEKLTLEIVARDVDIFIIDESLRHVLLDPYGLHPLEELRNNFGDEAEIEEFVLDDHETGDPHLYAVPLDNDSTLITDLGLELPAPLIGAVVRSSYYKELAEQILAEFL